MRLILAKQLFTFVTAAPVQKPNGEMMAVSGTNNESERTLRSPAQARDTGRTNKTSAGTPSNGDCERVAIAPSVSFDFYAIERDRGSRALVGGWPQLFRSAGRKLGLIGGQPHANRPSLLDRLLPVPGG